ncbi:WXG100 family type VII secretion target [Mycolicibacterium farcinogenes]|nr:WXG100 family type VII secretion target [Mycolicibacterium farcinogenes]
MNTDLEVLIKEGGNFDRISGELQAVMGHVEATGGALAMQMKGDPDGAGAAAQAALTRFHEAADKVRLELQQIAENIHTTAEKYGATEQDQASTLHSEMKL